MNTFKLLKETAKDFVGGWEMWHERRSMALLLASYQQEDGYIPLTMKAMAQMTGLRKYDINKWLSYFRFSEAIPLPYWKGCHVEDVGFLTESEMKIRRRQRLEGPEAHLHMS